MRSSRPRRVLRAGELAHLPKEAIDLLLGLAVAIAVAFLNAIDKLAALTADLLKVGVGQLAPLLLHSAPHLIPALQHLALARLAAHLAGLPLLALLTILVHVRFSLFGRKR